MLNDTCRQPFVSAGVVEIGMEKCPLGRSGAYVKLELIAFHARAYEVKRRDGKGLGSALSAGYGRV